MLSTYLSGGLNHQIEHHMFPAVAVHHFPLITKKIQRVCEKHGVRMNVRRDVSDAWRTAIKHVY